MSYPPFKNLSKTIKPPFTPTWMTIVFDEHANITEIINPRQDLLFQHSTDELLGMNAEELENKITDRNKKQARIIAEHIKKTYREKRNVYFEFTSTLQDHRMIHAICYSEYIPNHGVCSHIMEVHKEDLEEARQETSGQQLPPHAEDALLKFENLFNTLTAGIEYYDTQGELLDTNQYMVDLFGVKNRETFQIIKTNLYTKRYLSENVKESIRRGEQTVSSYEYDFDFITENQIFETCKRGKMFLEIRTSPVVNKNGTLSGTLVVLIDLTKNMHLQKKYETLYLQNETILQSLPVGIELYSNEGTLKYINDRDCEIFGINKEQAFSENRNLFTDSNFPKETKEAVKKGIKIRTDFEYNFDTVRKASRPSTFKENEIRRIECNGTPLINTKGEKEGYVFIMTNTTDYHRQSKLLEKTRQNLIMAMEAGDMQAWTIDMKEQTLTLLQGNTTSQTITLEQGLDTLHPEDAATFRKEYQKLRDKSASKLNLNHRYKDPSIKGGYRYFETSVLPIYDESGEIILLTGIRKEITNAHFQQIELQESKFKTDLAIRTAEIVLWEYDNQTRLFTCYNEPLNHYDKSIKLTLEDYYKAIHPDDVENLRSITMSWNEGKNEPFNFDIRIKSSYDSEWQYCTISGAPSKKNEEGGVVKYVGFRKNSTKLQKKKALLNNVLNNIPLPIHIKDVENNYQYIFRNKESKKFFGDNDFKTAYQIVKEEDAAEIQRIDQEVFETEKTYFGQEKITTLDGREYDTIVQKRVIYDEGKKLLLIVRWDVSLQNELLRKSKILSISMDALDAFTWYYNSEDKELILGEGFEKTGGNHLKFNSIEKFAQQIHPDEKAQFIQSMNEFTTKSEGEFVIEYRIDFTHTGKYEWWECRGNIENSIKDGIPHNYVYGMSINIDAHKKNELALLQNKIELAQLNKQNELVLNNVNSGLAYISSDYMVKWENVSTCFASLSFEAYKKGELCYKSAHNRTAPCENCVMQRAIRSKQMEEIVFHFENGKSIEVFATPVLNPQGEVDGVVIRTDDITERIQMISNLEKAKLQAEESNKLKSTFLANMSHEIRTPLNAIVGFSDLLMNTADPEEQTGYMRIIATNNDLLLKLINDILDLSKIEVGSVELNYEKFDLAAYFDEIALSMQLRITNPEIEFICTNPYENCVVNLDKNRLTQILTNYITNSAKYTTKGYIEMGYEAVSEGIKIYVKDSGIGIPEEKKNKVFQRFEKLDEFAQGTGLGLSICKAIVGAFGGKIGFESLEGEGSTFWAFIPCNTDIHMKEELTNHREEQTLSDQGSTTTPSQKKKILVAEDIASNYLLVSAILKSNYDLTQAVNGQIAVEKVRSEHFDLVLMDMKMPVMGGMEAVEKIREFNTEIPIIALTAHAFESDKEAALKIGCNDYLVKPINKSLLIGVLHKLLD